MIYLIRLVMFGIFSENTVLRYLGSFILVINWTLEFRVFIFIILIINWKSISRSYCLFFIISNISIFSGGRISNSNGSTFVLDAFMHCYFVCNFGFNCFEEDKRDESFNRWNRRTLWWKYFLKHSQKNQSSKT